MPITPSQHAERSPWWFKVAGKPWSPIALLVAVFVGTLFWQFFSPYTLIEDEAHYWEWSRQLDWSYYSKGPGIAWLIRASTEIFGVNEFAIRAPAALSLLLTGLACVRTARVFFEDRITVFISAVLVLGLPGVAFSSMLMTIDAPYIACWSWASYFAARAIMHGNNRNWLIFGILLAVGFLFKYTILLLIPGVLLAVLLTKNRRPPIKPVQMILGASLVLIGLIPVIVWNAGHDWATFRHLLGHLGMRGGDTENTLAGPGEPYTPLWTLEYLALLVLVGGAALGLGIFAWINTKKRAGGSEHTAARVLVSFGTPTLVFYLLVSLKTQVEGNWAMSAFVMMVPPGAWAVRDGLARHSHPVRFLWGAVCVGALLVFSFFPLAEWLSTRRIIGEMIPIHRLTAMREHASDTQRVIDDLRAQTGLDPIVIADHYGRASQLAFYLDRHPTIYCNSALIGGRKTQYDLWDETDLADQSLQLRLRGQPGVLFGSSMRVWSFAFDDVVNLGPLVGEPKEHQTTFAGFSFSNFDDWTPLPAKGAE